MTCRRKLAARDDASKAGVIHLIEAVLRLLMPAVGPLTRAVILLYALASAALYCGILPLWEGFDELYHYGYVQYVSTWAAFPIAGRSALSRELWSSLDYAPLSSYIQPFLQRPTTNFQDYFALSDAERARRRQALDTIPRELQREASPRENYEAKHAPLTYLFLAPLDRLLSGAPLSDRVLILRLTLSLASIVLLWIGMHALAGRLGLSGAMEAAALIGTFSCQMVLAVASHIANDALLLPWFLFFLLAIIRACESPSVLRVAQTAVAMAVGLLIKAFALFLLPLLLAPLLIALTRSRRSAVRLITVSFGIVLLLAGPWYMRNVVLYRSFTAAYDSLSDVTLGQVLKAAVLMSWPSKISEMVHSALWTGNNSFTSFSSATLNLLLALLMVALVLFGSRLQRTITELVVVSSIALYAVGLAATAAGFSASSNGQVAVAAPWYLPVLLAPVLLLCLAGLKRWQPAGTWLAVVNVLLWSYMAAATWLAKLIPQYGGFGDSRVQPRALWNWYLQNSALRDSILRTLCPAPLPALYGLMLLVIGSLLVACGLVLMGLVQDRLPEPARSASRPSAASAAPRA